MVLIPFIRLASDLCMKSNNKCMHEKSHVYNHAPLICDLTWEFSDDVMSQFSPTICVRDQTKWPLLVNKLRAF